MLGTPCLVLPGEVTCPLERKDAALLALLALEGPTQRARAARLLWPDADDEQARTNLRQRLFRLRRTARSALVAAGTMLRLADGLSVDVVELATDLATDSSQARGELLGAAAYGDTPGLDEWVLGARKRLQDNRLALLAGIASELEAKGEIAAAIPYAQRLVADDPLLEHAHRRLIRLHYLRGDRAAALGAVKRCRDVLAAELGTRPSAETAQLAALVASGTALPDPMRAPRPVALLRPPRLVGRTTAWQALRDVASRGGVAIVLGEPGIGKTRLLGDFAAAAGDVPVCGGRPGDEQLPYTLLSRMVRSLMLRFGPPGGAWIREELARILPEVGAAPAGPLDRLRLLQAMTGVLGEWQARGLAAVVVDDLQFADQATIETLLPLVSELPERPIAWLIGVRTSDVPPALTAWMDLRDPGSAIRIPLGPLDEAAVEALLVSLDIEDLDAGTWAPSLLRHTGGNPLFILETLHAMSETRAWTGAAVRLPAPRSVGSLVERRLAQLGADSLRLARLAAVAGPDFDVDLAAQVLRCHALDLAEPWRELEAANILRDSAFAHDLIHETTARSLPAAIARWMHGEVAGVLAARGAPPARVAAHWFAAENWPRAAASFADAARAAYAASRRVEEFELWGRVVDSCRRDGDEAMAFTMRCRAIDSMLATRQISEVLAATGQLVADARTPAEELDALLARSTTLLMAAQSADALAIATRARTLATELRKPRESFDAARTIALALAQLHRAADGVAVLEPYGAAAEASSDLVQRFGYWSDYAYVVQLAGRRRTAADAYARAIRLAEELGDVNETVTCMTNLAGLLAQLGRAREAHAAAEKAHRLRARVGDSEGAAAGAAAMNRASFAVALGRYQEALALFEEASRCFGRADDSPWPTVCDAHVANTYLQLGQFARARQALKPVSDAVKRSARARRLVIEARIDRACGSSGLPRIRQALELLGNVDDPHTTMLARLEAGFHVGAAEALASATALRRTAESMEYAAAAMKARLLEVDARLRAGDSAAAAGHARDVERDLGACRPADLYYPEALWILSRAYDAASDGDAAERQLRSAQDWIEQTALPNVSPFFRDSFLHRNLVNRALLTAALRRLQPRHRGQ